MSPQPAPSRRLAQRLDAEIAAASEPLQRAVLQVQRAVLELRRGRLGQARAALDRLHAESLDCPDARLAGWLQLAEGQYIYFSSFGREARERLLQAQALAVADPGLRALAQAWLAQWAAVNRELDDFLHHASAACRAWPGLHSHAAGAGMRLSMALASGWTLAGEHESAARWDALAREQAALDGDDLGLSALIYNQAQRRVARLRRAALDGRPGEAPAQLLGVDSVSHVDRAVGGSVRADLTPLLRAQLLTLQGDWAEAAALLQAHLPSALASGLSQIGPSLPSELAWCWACLGHADKARRLADWMALQAPVIQAAGADADELVALQHRLAQTYDRIGDSPRAARHRAELAHALVLERQQQQRWGEALGAVPELVKPPCRP